MDHHLLGAFLQCGRQVGVYLADLLPRLPGRAGRLDERQGDPRPAVPQHPQREQARIQREPGSGERDGTGEDVAEPGRVTERGQRHHGAFLVATSPPQVRSDRAVCVAERRRVADGLGDPVADAMAVGTAVADGGGTGLAEAVGDEHGGFLVPGGGERVESVCPVMGDAADDRAWELLPKCPHPPPIAGVDDREAGCSRHCAWAGIRPQQIMDTAHRSGQVSVASEVIGDNFHVGSRQARLREQPRYGLSWIVAGVLDAGQAFLFHHPGEVPVHHEGGGGIMRE